MFGLIKKFSNLDDENDDQVLEKEEMKFKKLTVKEKQGTLTCNHECSFEDKKGKCCRWEIGAVVAFRSGVISIANAEAAMDLVYALGLVTRFFIFNPLHSILNGFIMQNKWM